MIAKQEVYSNLDKELQNIDSILLSKIPSHNIFETNYIINRAEALNIAKVAVPKLYTKNSGYYNERINSHVIGELIKIKSELDIENISLNDALIMLCCLLNQSIKGWFKFCDRLLARRIHKSWHTVNQYAFLLGKTNLAKYKKINGKIYIELNLNYIKEDPYIKVIHNKYIKQEIKTKDKITRKIKSIYYNDRCKRIKDREIRYMIMGIIIAYNSLITEYNLDPFRKEMYENYGKREDIEYLIIPVHIIARNLGWSINKTMTRVYEYYKGSKFISKHDKVYVMTNNENNFYNEMYKSFDLVKRENVELCSNHLQVTKYSAILHKDEFENCKTGQYVLNNLDKYKQIVMHTLNEFKYKNFYEYEIDSLDTDKIKLLYEDKNLLDKVEKDINTNLTEHSEFALYVNGPETDSEELMGASIYYEKGSLSNIIDFEAIHSKSTKENKFLRSKINWTKIKCNQAVNFINKIINRNNYISNLLDKEAKYESEYIYNSKLLNQIIAFIKNKLKKLDINSKEYKDTITSINHYNFQYEFLS